MATGITKRHSKGCAARDGGRCRCNAGCEAWVWLPREKRKVSKMFAREIDAKTWRADAQAAANRGGLAAPSKQTMRQAAEAWLDGAAQGRLRNRSGDPYKPSALRGYEQALRLRVLPLIGGMKLSAVSTRDLQALVERWQAEGLPASTIRNTLKPVQAIYRRAASDGLQNPTRDLQLPAMRSREVEIIDATVGARLLAAAPDSERAMWATALYAGLRYGELRALRCGRVDTAAGTIRVVESWDDRKGSILPKTRHSIRTVPMPAVLRDEILKHRMRSRYTGEDDLVFGVERDRPFTANVIYRRADRAWKRAGLSERLRLHQARHTYASFMIAAGVNAKALATYMGHSSITVTIDLYGHLMPGSEAEAAGLLDGYLTAQLEQAAEQVRSAEAV